MMPVLLNAADRPLFLGSRPTPFPGRRRLPGGASNPFSKVEHVEASTAFARLRSYELSATRFFQFALANAVGLWLIVGSGAAVRLTDSGLGCRHWPGCERGHPLPEKNVHAFVEFGNRVVGGVVITLALVTWLAARRTPGLPDWVRRVALLVFLGALAQAPLGYLAVASHLRWPVVMAHLLLSIVLLAGAVVVAVEALGLRDGRSPPLVPIELRRLALVFTAAGFALIVSGTFATAAGPSLGRRRAYRPLRLTRANGVRPRSDRRCIPPVVPLFDRLPRRLSAALARPLPVRNRLARAAASPDGSGEIQWRTHLPWEVVLVHVVLAAAVWGGTVALAALFFRPPRSLLPASA